MYMEKKIHVDIKGVEWVEMGVGGGGGWMRPPPPTLSHGATNERRRPMSERLAGWTGRGLICITRVRRPMSHADHG